MSEDLDFKLDFGLPEEIPDEARSIRVEGVVQGVGFRPFVYRLAHRHRLAGWVKNDQRGVEIYVEGDDADLDAFVRDLETEAPPASAISALVSVPVAAEGVEEFVIRHSETEGRPTTRISPDLPLCDDCREELEDPDDRRFGYPYVNCTNCGPRYSIILGLPYDRPATTMRDWPLCAACAAEYDDPDDRRFHAQPVACPECGPQYYLRLPDGTEEARGPAAITAAAQLLRRGKVVAIKGIGGYHLACAARDEDAVAALRERKFRKEKPFALMVRDLETAKKLAHVDEAEKLMTSPARPIVIVAARAELPGVAPDNRYLGIMLPYAPLHELLFAAGAPAELVLTSANRSSEPIAFRDDDAFERLAGIADAFLVGERPIARRVDDSVVRHGLRGPVILRRARGYAPRAVARLPVTEPVLALGADLKSTVTLVVDGEAVVSQHLGDLDHHDAGRAFRETIADLLAMYELETSELTVVHDCHPQYVSTVYAHELDVRERRAVQHHRAHVASVLAERGEWHQRVIGVAFDGTGLGDDGTIWGGEIFLGSVAGGFERIGHLRPARLAGGDAAARYPVQAAAGFLAETGELPDLAAPPFSFPARYEDARKLLDKDLRVHTTTSVGRLFDAVAAIAGFTGPTTFEGQAAIWLEQQARLFTGRFGIPEIDAYPFPYAGGELDYRPALRAALDDRARGRPPSEIAAAFHCGLSDDLCEVLLRLCHEHGVDVVVLSGGVFQNALLLTRAQIWLGAEAIDVWVNHKVPANDGGISLGQAAMCVASSADDS